jgi:hypothetical protein
MSSYLAILNNELTDTAVSGLKVTGDVRQIDGHGDSARFVALPDADALNRTQRYLSDPEITVGPILASAHRIMVGERSLQAGEWRRGILQASNWQAAP